MNEDVSRDLHQWWCGGKEPCACTETWKTKTAERLDSDGTIESILDQARANERRTLKSVYDEQD